MPDAPPMPFSRDDWRRRWMQTGNRQALHRLSSITWDDAEHLGGAGVVVCGKEGAFRMPGFFSRMDALRCRACCKVLGIPTGRGAPMNVASGEDWQDA